MIVDPNETLGRIVRAAIDNDPWTLREAAEELVEWLEGGGFPPDHSALQRALSPGGGS